MSVFSKLHPEIIKFHILPRLDGQSLIIFSCVSSQFRHLICNNNDSDDRWRNICTTTWPSLLVGYPIHSDMFEIISFFSGGYRGFFSDAFPSIHPLNIPNPCPPPPPIKHRLFYYAFDIFLHDEPLFSVHSYQYIKPHQFECSVMDYSKPNKNFIPVKKEGIKEYLKEKLTLSCVVIDPHGKRAASLFNFGCKPVSVIHHRYVSVVYETLLPAGMPFIYTEMVKFQVTVICAWEGEGEDRFHVKGQGEDRFLFPVNKCVNITMSDMNGKYVSDWHGAFILLNVIGNAQRKKNHNNY